MIPRASAGITTLHIIIIKCLISWTIFLFIFVYTLSDFVLTLFLQIEIKNELHRWLYRGADRDKKKSKLNLIIYTCTWPILCLLQLTEKINFCIIYIYFKSVNEYLVNFSLGLVFWANFQI